jgi:beta-lactamase superfamily II metal-dependent hydrolase
MVIDAGGKVPFDPAMSEAGRADVLMEPGRRVVVPFLQRRGIERVDLMVVSHPHPDHAGGLAAVAKAMHILIMRMEFVFINEMVHQHCLSPIEPEMHLKDFH